MVRLRSLLNPLRQPLVTFLYVSHRVLRWSLTPVALVLLLVLGAALAGLHGRFYAAFFAAQVLFYGLAYLGWRAESRGRSPKLLLVPLYFTSMNVAVFAGFRRYLRGTQSAAWEKAARTQPLEGNLSIPKA